MPTVRPAPGLPGDNEDGKGLAAVERRTAGGGARIQSHGGRPEAGRPRPSSTRPGRGLRRRVDGVSMRITVKVTREGRYWVGVPDGYPGSCMGRSIMELMQEAQAILPFMASGPDGAPTPDVVIHYIFTDVPVELSDAIHR